MLFNRKLIDHGWGDLIPSIDTVQKYPYILKKRVDDYGTHSYLIRDAAEELPHADIIMHPDFYHQRFIPGAQEYATHVVCRDEKIVFSINIKYTFGKQEPIKGKDRVSYIEICECPYLDVFASILRLLNFEGLCCLNYKVHDGHLFLLEINPRFGSSLSRFFFAFTRTFN